MMVIIETIKKIATGKTKIERRQEAEANSIIRRKAMASALKEREIQSIRLAKEKEKAYYDARIKKIREPKKLFSPIAPEFKTYGSPFGQPRFVKIIRTTPKYNIRQTINRDKYNVLGF